MSPLATRLWQGYDLIQRGDYRAARELLEQLDCDDARHMLAYLYSSGLGGHQNTDKAIQLYRQLADNKANIQAAYDLGMLFLKENRLTDAANYLSMSSSTHSQASYWLAQIYNGHNNAPVNHALYMQYLQQAARQKHYFAQRDLLILKRDSATSLLQKTAYRTRLLILKSSVLPTVLFNKKWREKYF